VQSRQSQLLILFIRHVSLRRSRRVGRGAAALRVRPHALLQVPCGVEIETARLLPSARHVSGLSWAKGRNEDEAVQSDG